MFYNTWHIPFLGCGSAQQPQQCSWHVCVAWGGRDVELKREVDGTVVVILVIPLSRISWTRATFGWAVSFYSLPSHPSLSRHTEERDQMAITSWELLDEESLTKEKNSSSMSRKGLNRNMVVKVCESQVYVLNRKTTLSHGCVHSGPNFHLIGSTEWICFFFHILMYDIEESSGVHSEYFLLWLNMSSRAKRNPFKTPAVLFLVMKISSSQWRQFHH